MAVGERNSNATITEDDARLIKLLRRDGMPIKTIAEKMECSYHAAKECAYGRTWAHVAIDPV